MLERYPVLILHQPIERSLQNCPSAAEKQSSPVSVQKLHCVVWTAASVAVRLVCAGCSYELCVQLWVLSHPELGAPAHTACLTLKLMALELQAL